MANKKHKDVRQDGIYRKLHTDSRKKSIHYICILEKLHHSTFLLGYDVQMYFKITLHTRLKATTIFCVWKKGANLDTSKIFLTKVKECFVVMQKTSKN